MSSSRAELRFAKYLARQACEQLDRKRNITCRRTSIPLPLAPYSRATMLRILLEACDKFILRPSGRVAMALARGHHALGTHPTSDFLIDLRGSAAGGTERDPAPIRRPHRQAITFI